MGGQLVSGQADAGSQAFDGIPRSLPQAEALREYIDVLRIIHLVCRDESEMVERMKRRAIKENRLDDADENVIRNRFKVYEEETKPVLEYYPADIIREIDALGSPASVLQHVLEEVVPVQDEHFRNPLAAG